MRKIEINRISDDGTQTLGELRVIEKGEVIYECKTLELPYKDNSRNISCIPEGEYKVTRRYSEKYKHHFLINEVPNRSYILIHPANYYSQLRGCIAVGSEFKKINDDNYLDVSDSKKTLLDLLSLITDETVLSIYYNNFKNYKMKKVQIAKSVLTAIRLVKKVLPIINKEDKSPKWVKVLKSVGTVAVASTLILLGVDSDTILIIVNSLLELV